MLLVQLYHYYQYGYFFKLSNSSMPLWSTYGVTMAYVHMPDQVLNSTSGTTPAIVAVVTHSSMCGNCLRVY